MKYPLKITSHPSPLLGTTPSAHENDLKIGFGHSSCATNHIDNSFLVK